MKKAFSLIELVFVVVVIGILAAVIIPRTDNDATAQAAIELQSHIRYTQHLALVDDQFNSNDTTWFQNRWHLHFTGNSYTIHKNNIHNNVFNDPIVAVDPQSGNNFENIDLNDKYSVTIAFTGGCENQTVISFDHMGRPMVGDLSDDTQSYMELQLMRVPCVITLSGSGDDIAIRIIPETGYVQGI